MTTTTTTATTNQIQKACSLMDIQTYAELRMGISARYEFLFKAWKLAFDNGFSSTTYWTERIERLTDSAIAAGFGQSDDWN